MKKKFTLWRYFILANLILTSCNFPSGKTKPNEAPTQTPLPTSTPIVITPTPTPTPVGQYIVRPGDTLSGIAEEFGVPLDYLVQVNGIKNQDLIFPGDMLTIPKWPPDPPIPDKIEGKEIIVELLTKEPVLRRMGKS